MSLASALVAVKTANTTLNTLVGTRFHPDVLPQDVELPAVRFQVISRPRPYAMGAVPDRAMPRVQFDGYASTSALRTTLAAAIRGAFNRYSGTIASETIASETIDDIRIESEREGIEMLDTETEAYRISMDLIVDFRES